MFNNSDTYNRPAPRGWRERMMRRFSMGVAAPLRKGELIVPDWVASRGLVFFFISMFACWGAFGYVPELDLVLVSCISVVLYFYGSMVLTRKWKPKGEKRFVRDVFIAAFVVRLLWVLYMYFFFNPEHFNTTYGPDDDVYWYMDFGHDIYLWLTGESTRTLPEIVKWNTAAIDDTGYPFWLGLIYLVTGYLSDVFIPFLVKCILGAYCVVCIYHVARRHFGIGTARMAALFVALNPNMIYWCASMMKEAELVFVCCLAVDNFDRVLSSGNRFTFKNLLPGILAGIYLFFMRTALGVAMFVAVFAHIVMASNKVIGVGKKIIAGLLVFIVLVFSVGERVIQESRTMYESVQEGGQKNNMEWRSQRQGGNSFAKYAGTAVFAPLIFTIPFPTFNAANEGQLIQMQLAGGSYIKNILSYFVIVVMILLLISGDWRRHVFILAYTLSYLAVLVVSSYAQSGRFHMPIWPMLMLFAAYGIQIAKSNIRIRRGFSFALVVEVLVCLAWAWFKLKGRGMI